MKKAILATALLSTFSIGASATEIPYEEITTSEIKEFVENSKFVTTIDGKNFIVNGDKVWEVEEGTSENSISFSHESRNGMEKVIINTETGAKDYMNGDVHEKSKIIITEGSERETYNNIVEAVENGEVADYVTVTDSQGNEIATIDASNVEEAKEEFEKLDIHAKAELMRRTKLAAENGQVSTGNYVDDAKSYVERATASNELRIDSLETRFNDMAERQHRAEVRMNQNEGKMSNGIAGVAAMANIPTVTGKTTFGAGVGHFNGSNAIAIGASTGLENGISLKGSLSYAKGKFEQKDVVVGAGIGYSF